MDPTVHLGRGLDLTVRRGGTSTQDVSYGLGPGGVVGVIGSRSGQQ